MPQSSDALLLLPSEVAAMLRLKVNSVYAAAAAGKLPAVRLWRGRRKSLLRFRRTDIEAMIAGHPTRPRG
jgi:excisionase family DNA binding protein